MCRCPNKLTQSVWLRAFIFSLVSCFLRSSSRNLWRILRDNCYCCWSSPTHAAPAIVMSLSWIFEFGCCFCGCDNKEDFSKANDPFYIRSPSNRVIDKQVSSKGYSRFQYKESEPLISSTSCSGYQSYLACTESSDADDERSVDIRHNLRSKLNAVTEEETPRVKQHSNDQVNYTFVRSTVTRLSDHSLHRWLLVAFKCDEMLTILLLSRMKKTRRPS